MDIAIDLKDIVLDALEQINIVFFITDTEGKILFVNKAFEELTGYRKEEVLGKNPNILKSGEQDEKFYKEMWDTISKGDIWSGKIINKKKDGSLYIEKLNIFPIKKDGKIKYYLAHREDISKLIEMEEKSFESQKLEAIGTMAGQLAHDFNNLLTVVIGSMEMIGDELKKDSVVYQLTQEILKSSKENAQIIKQLLIFSRKQSMEFKKVNLNEIIKEMDLLIKTQISSQIKLFIELSDDLKDVCADVNMIKQVIMNITANARDAINGTGEIKIKTYNFSSDNINLYPYLKGNFSVIEIADSGKGIPKEVLPHIFEPFYTTKPKGKGTGLGLSSAYGIIQQHKGKILAENSSKGGAIFKIFLPQIA